MSRTRIQSALGRVETARGFTKQFLALLTAEEWFWQPPELTTHIAWQVAHLSVAQYRLCLERIRGRVAADDAFMPVAYLERFMLGSQPVAGAANIRRLRRSSVCSTSFINDRSRNWRNGPTRSSTCRLSNRAPCLRRS